MKGHKMVYKIISKNCTYEQHYRMWGQWKSKVWKWITTLTKNIIFNAMLISTLTNTSISKIVGASETLTILVKNECILKETQCGEIIWSLGSEMRQAIQLQLMMRCIETCYGSSFCTKRKIGPWWAVVPKDDVLPQKSRGWG